MNSRIPGLFAILALLILGGCASMSADECMMSDWHAVGFEDGSRGYTADRLGERRKACAKHGIATDFSAYRAGHAEGLRDFCQPSRGFDLGASGGQYHGLCAADQEPHFVDAWRSGKQLHAMRSNVNHANYEINARKNELARIDDLIRAKEAALISRETTTENRILILADLKDLSEDVGQMEAEIVELSEERAVYEQQLASYEAVLADSGYY
jgi:hypothetical protein